MIRLREEKEEQNAVNNDYCTLLNFLLLLLSNQIA